MSKIEEVRGPPVEQRNIVQSQAATHWKAEGYDRSPQHSIQDRSNKKLAPRMQVNSLGWSTEAGHQKQKQEKKEKKKKERTQITEVENKCGLLKN